MPRTEPDNDRGQRIKRACDVRGLTAEDLAAQIGVHFTTAYRWRKGQTFPSMTHAKLMADALQVDIGWLLWGEGSGPREAA